MIAPGPDNRYFKAARVLTCGWIAGLVLALYPYTGDPAAPVKHLISAVAAIALSGVWAAGVASGRAPYRRLHAGFCVLLAFLVVQGAAAALSATPARSFDAIQPWFVFTAIAFVIYQVFPEPRHLRNLFRAIVASVTLSSVYGLLQYAGLDPFPWSDRAVEEYRGLPATYGNPNLAGHALVIALVLCAGVAADAWQRGKRRLEPLAWAVLGGLMALHLALSGMRGGAVALAFAGLFVAVYLLADRRGATPGRAGLAAAGATGLLLGLTALGGLALAPALPLDSSLQLRLNGYAGAAALVQEHWATGVGPGNYAAHNIGRWTDFEALWYALENKRNFHVHNEWLEVAVESGLAGLALLFAVFLFAIVTPFAHPGFATPGHRALLLAIPAALVAVAADACTGFNLHVPVSAALFFVLAVLQPAMAPTRPLRGYSRLLPPLLIAVTLLHGAAMWRQFQAAEAHQRARGAIAWAREQRAAGQMDAAAHAETVARESLAAAAARTPHDYTIPMLAGDLALEQARYRDATVDYERALVYSPHLPRLHVQQARAQLRLAGRLRGNARGDALDRAETHAASALERCPELAEAWAMRGWTAYLRAEDQAADGGGQLATAIEAFEKARQRGLANDTNLNATLARAYGRAGTAPAPGSGPAPSELLEACVMASPDDREYWDAFARTATDPAGAARYRQALIYHLARYSEGESALFPRTAPTLAARLAAVSGEPAATALARRTLAGVLTRYPDQLAFWGAWLSLYPARERAAALRGQVASLENATVPPPVRALDAALGGTGGTALEEACSAMRQALATAPGGARQGYAATALEPLLALLDDRVASSSEPATALAGARASLGAAWFEAGRPERAEALLRAAERLLPVPERARVQYYRSRALAALGQPEAALALARQAVQAGDGPPEYPWQLARCLAGSGEREAAVFLYESLLASLPGGHPYRNPVAGALATLRERAAEEAP